ncbi:intraflagellar transport protein 46 homolog isoform X2 [Hyposmocoma kahamanoa]|uniref:intraflagellar transport protein 46 homolog isoform X2 n=1 Tax=Hyposmocoma kahamanoa TaxID=1477025 RepID=UPI000E6D874E|nr:intraflagellar transport protein 46 homolog isoform X2 [Hyposmocoma kahamanoa]
MLVVSYIHTFCAIPYHVAPNMPPDCKSTRSFDKECPTEKVAPSSVAMETSDKHCQTFIVKREKSGIVREEFALELMYDETVVVNAQEIDSPSSSDGEGVVKAAMAKFNPPVRHTAKHDFDSESESESEQENFLDNVSGEDQSPGRKPQPLQTVNKSARQIGLPKQSSKESSSGKTKPTAKRDDSSNSDISQLSEETDSADLEADGAEVAMGSGRKRGVGVVVPAEGAYDPKQYQDLKVPAEIDNLFQYIMKYTPQKIDIDFKLQPFIPEYVPAVGDLDAFIKVSTPACNVRAAPLSERVLEHIDNLGLTVLDEPAAEQSDSALLHLQMRAISKISSTKSTVLTKKIENAEKNSKAVDRWIKDVSELHLSKPAPTVTYTSKMPDIDSLMEEWPETIEETLNEVGFPPPNIDCSLSQYVDLVCGLFDIPIGGDSLNDRIQALHLLFSLYSAVRSSQLYADRQKEKNVENI